MKTGKEDPEITGRTVSINSVEAVHPSVEDAKGFNPLIGKLLR